MSRLVANRFPTITISYKNVQQIHATWNADQELWQSPFFILRQHHENLIKTLVRLA
ncbi:hypothetical protein CEV33_4294 [Brucella grignonensis]|uniref:Uncharacterized protein n=1 Tax=Brucella grignonensis TaxID=94627 RepID=A0A256FN52_9HYPH|nr:hypothetical protein CEV33_4294 [Brucella grignonensis]